MRCQGTLSPILYNQKHVQTNFTNFIDAWCLMTLKRVTCTSFPWNKAVDFRTPILCPNMDKNMIEAARAGKMHELRYIQIRKFFD